jgi:mono/diheme cytochrome c family protein
MAERENYTPHLLAGLVLTLVLVVGLAFATLGEAARLKQAAASFTSERVQRGRVLYNEQCVNCHGAQGEGGVGPALNNRTLLKNTLDSVFFSIIRSGVPGTQMPAWSVDYGGPLTDEEIRDLVAFIRAWEPNAPEVKPAVFEPDPVRGALMFASTCSICHGENGKGGTAPALNDPARLQALDNDWYRGVIRYGRPAKGMPTWGTVLSPNQIEDLIALIEAWRQGTQVAPAFRVTDLLDNAVFALEQDDLASARLHIERGLSVVQGQALEVLRNAAVLLDAGDRAGALATLQALRAQWPLGDPTAGAAVYSTYCAPCHGVQGEGGIGVKLQPNAFVQSQTNAQLVEFLLTGRPGTAMAGFKGRLSETDLADVIAFLRLWQQQP